jgi:sulfur-oxidizing protein SoxA
VKSAVRAQPWGYPFTRSLVYPFTLLLLAAACIAHGAEPFRPQPLKSGLEFSGAEVRALQQDDFSSPAMLWATRGEKLWREPTGASGKSCASCHQDARVSMQGVAPRYPKIDAGTARLTNIEGRINLCRTRHQQAAESGYESDELLALTAYVGLQSRGLPVNVTIDTQNRNHFERGRDLYYTRMGQMNLACTHCHDRNYGRKLLNDTISQGHGNPYPAYRLEWQGMGSLHRRLRACFFGVRAERPAAGSQELLDLELFLAWRAQGLKIETPGVRK